MRRRRPDPLRAGFLALFVSALFMLSSATLPAVEYRGPDGISFDLPEGWAAVGEPGIGSFAFANRTSTAFLQVFRFAVAGDSSILEVFDALRSSIASGGARALFVHSGTDAVFATVEFTAAGNEVAGYAVAVRTPTADVVALAYSAVGAGLDDEILSALDSIAFTDADLTRPGPVSQFMLAPGDDDATAVISFGGFSAEFGVDTSEFEAAQLVVEREARLLAKLSGEEIDSWKRFYRMIYRDGYGRFAELGERFAAWAAPIDDRTIAEALLEWVQGFEYSRTGSLADLLNPYEASLRESGDCDSRGLVYATLLHYAGIDASLLVSEVYSHSVSSVSVAGPGAVIATDRGPQVIAETTETVALGMIAADQADPAGWIVVDLDGKRGPR